MVECDLAKVEVASSNLVSRSKLPVMKAEGCRMKIPKYILPPSSFRPAFRRCSQVVRQRSAKPLFIGSIPITAFLESISYGQLKGCP